MKKILILFCFVLILSSCPDSFNDVIYTINNNSSKIISFDFYNENVSLQPKPEEPDELIIYSKTFTVNSDEGSIKPSNVVFSGHKQSIKMNSVNLGRAGIEYNFIDVSPFDLNAANTLPVGITITAGTYIDYMGETELTIAPSETIAASIYTNRPVFSTTADYPVIIEWKFSNGSVNVIIR